MEKKYVKDNLSEAQRLEIMARSLKPAPKKGDTISLMEAFKYVLNVSSLPIKETI